MNGWFQRWRQRQADLRSGADADLILLNRKRRKISFALMGGGLSLVWIQSKIKLAGIWADAFIVLGTILFVFGGLSALWARAEASFLNQPDPKEPPKLFP